MALLDLPLTSPKIPAGSARNHQFIADAKRGLKVIAGYNMLLFKKEIKEGPCELASDIIATHRYANNEGREAKSFLPNNPYYCEVILTNISGDQKQVNVLY
jgi:hypothetical protein